MPENPIYYIILLRHAESTGNSRGLFQGHSDFELSEHGMQQAYRLALRWSKEGMYFDKIISSPLLRASQTAEIISKALKSEIELHADWMERDIGRYTGKPAAEITDLFPQSPYQAVGQTGDSQWGLYLRAGRAISDLLQRPPGRYLIVAHGGVINLAIYGILGISPSPGSAGPRFVLSNAGFAELTYTPSEHTWRLDNLNDRYHLVNMPSDQVRDLTLNLSEKNQSPAQEHDYAKLTDPPFQETQHSVRPASPSDLDGILEVFAEVDHMHAEALPQFFRPASISKSNRNFYSSLLSESNTRLFVADLYGEIAGALYAYVEESSNYPLAVPRRHLTVGILSVKTPFRRMGIGMALMEKAHIWARELGIRSVELIVWEFNESARHFYESLGYKTAKRRMWLEFEEGGEFK